MNSIEDFGADGGADPFRHASESFTTTHWSVVLNAGQGDGDAARAALAKLCQVYWLPIYAFIRRTRGRNHHDAEDLTQGFFAHVLENGAIGRVEREKGKFRTFLLKVAGDFLANEWKKARALKRGGRVEIVSIDEPTAEDFYANVPIETTTPADLYERVWAATLLENAMARLERDYRENNKLRQFQVLEPGIADLNAKDGFYARCAAELGVSADAAKVAMHRLRRRYRELLRQEVAQTVAGPGEVDGEISQLFEAVDD